ncbi:RAI1 like PD-XK nuclease-domain-containing protein [Lipomyces japonicus]|uniref:RAI1 like PD-XK nuclease-domain-containing protein n=1 Tax=Lipomyces japonicus TaxID=56871 RepID=UPI0034CF7D4E
MSYNQPNFGRHYQPHQHDNGPPELANILQALNGNSGNDTQQARPDFTLPISARLRGVPMRQPREITSFSYDEDRNLHLDDSSMSYFYLLKSDLALSSSSSSSGGIDLSDGFREFKKRDENVDEHLDGLLLSLMDLEKKTDKKTTGDIITFRGLITKLLCLPYSRNDPFELNATWFDGQLFIEENLNYKLASQRRLDERGEIMTYWGYKFESIATIPKSWKESSRREIENRQHQVVNNYSQYCSVVKTGLGDTRLVIGGEVDCVYDYKPSEQLNQEVTAEFFDSALDHYVELKTNKVIQTDRDANLFEKKLLKIWAQSYLLGVPRIVIGFRTDQGFLQTLEQFETQKIPAMIKKSKYSDSRSAWDGVESLAFLAAALQWLKTSIPRNQDGVVWKIKYVKGSEFLSVSRSADQSFLHKDFVQWRRERNFI